MSEYSLFIDGAAVSTEETFDVLNPADGTVVAACPLGTIDLVDAAVGAARRALPSWAAMSDMARSNLLLAIAELIVANHAELATLITLEQGKAQSGPGANFEVTAAVAWTRATASLVLNDETIEEGPAGKIVVTRKAVGVVASITPWNWPLLIAVWHIMPALKAGCTVVVKPSPYTPLATLRLVELMNRVLPAGAINSVTGGAGIGGHLTQHSGVDKVVLTGSTETGKKVMASAASTLKKFTLELGGNDAGIVLPGTDITPLLERLFWGCFINGGQTCAALKRLYVHEDQYDAVIERFSAYVKSVPVGNGLDPTNLIGPLSNEMQLNKVIALVDEARTRGARIVVGGERVDGPGYFYPLTIVANAEDDMRVVAEEQFGPVIPILKYKTIDEAIERANSLDVGLGGSVWGNDPAVATSLARRLQCGTAWVNQHGTPHPFAPFGGIKQSGIGVAFGLDGLKEYTTTQVLNVAV